MVIPELFTGYGAKSADTWKDLQKFQFQPKPFGVEDIDIQVDYCGVCGSDLHTLSGGWGGTMYPVVVGHEIVGKAVRVGPKVSTIKDGDTVGVGANAWSCGECKACKADSEQCCPELVETYNFKYQDGSRSWGGYSDFVRIHQRFVFPVPAELSSAMVAPLFCAGVTVFSPLVRNNVGSGKAVGVIGIGGLGHFAIMFANALGAEVTAISHSSRKKDDAMKMGAKHFVDTSIKDWADPLSRSLDLIICTTFVKDMPLNMYIGLLGIGGTLAYVGIPEGDLPALPPTLMIGSNTALRGSNTGSKKEVTDMLDLVASKRIKSWIEEIPMSRCSDAVKKLSRGEARYRYVLKSDGSLHQK